jgi:hypothetical protein
MITEKQINYLKNNGFEIVSVDPFRAYACCGFCVVHLNSEEEAIDALKELKFSDNEQIISGID